MDCCVNLTMTKENLLLLHGALGSSTQMMPLAEQLKEKYEIHLLDFSGHGGRSIPENYSMDLFCNDVTQYLDDALIAETHIFGFSMGGYVALKVAERMGMRIGKIITLGTKFEWTPESAIHETSLLNPEKIKTKVPAFAERLKNRHHPAAWEEVMRNTAEMMIRLGSHPEWVPGVNSVFNEVLLMVGALDNMVSIDETQLVAEMLPKGHIKILEALEHPIEKADCKVVANEILRFIG